MLGLTSLVVELRSDADTRLVLSWKGEVRFSHGEPSVLDAGDVVVDVVGGGEHAVVVVVGNVVRDGGAVLTDCLPLFALLPN